jgi:hypothetical protein
MSALCRCSIPPFRYSDFAIDTLGEVVCEADGQDAQVTLETCLHCQAVWLKYLIEEPHYSRSGRWWRVHVSAAHAPLLTADRARAFIEQQSEGFVGGSYYSSAGHKITAPILVR